MSHNVRDMNARQLQEALRELALLGQLHLAVGTGEVRLGSLVHTSAGNYFVAVSGGPYMVAGQTYFAVSTAAPLGRELLGKKAGDTFPFRGKPLRISQVW
jgi:hypothetical protein